MSSVAKSSPHEEDESINHSVVANNEINNVSDECKHYKRYCKLQSKLQVNARLLQQHVAQTVGKVISLKDIHNIHARVSQVGVDSWEASLKELQNFQALEPHAVIDVNINSVTEELELIILQSKEMRDNLKQFPEIIQMDGTYGINQAGFPLYALVVEDADGCGRLGALAILKSETSLNIQLMLQQIKEHNKEIEQTQIIIVDKDFAEVNAIKIVLPEVRINLCIFHVLKAIRKEIVHIVDKVNHSEVFSIVHSLVYALDEQKFTELWAKLAVFPEFLKYMEVNWLPIKKWWAAYERMDCVNLGNNTNNRVESQFGKIKQIIDRKRRFNECLRLLVNVIQCGDLQSRFAHYRNLYKCTYNNAYKGDGAGFYDLITPYAAKLAIKELQKAGLGMHTVTAECYSTNISVSRNNTSESYLVTDDGKKCDCKFFKTMLLPCCHVFYARRFLQLLIEDIVAKRWKKSQQNSTVNTSQSYINSVVYPSFPRTLSKAEKFTKATKQLSTLATLMSEVGMAEFVNLTHFVQLVIQQVESGKECILLDDNIENQFIDINPDSEGNPGQKSNQAATSKNHESNQAAVSEKQNQESNQAAVSENQNQESNQAAISENQNQESNQAAVSENQNQEFNLDHRYESDSSTPDFSSEIEQNSNGVLNADPNRANSFVDGLALTDASSDLNEACNGKLKMDTDRQIRTMVSFTSLDKLKVNVVLPKGLKPRGCPKGCRESLNVKYGVAKQKKKGDNPNKAITIENDGALSGSSGTDKETGCEDQRKNLTKPTEGVSNENAPPKIKRQTQNNLRMKRKKYIDIDEGICHFCMKEEPEKAKMANAADNKILWVECEKNCKRWFHCVCLQFTGTNKVFVCKYCL